MLAALGVWLAVGGCSPRGSSSLATGGAGDAGEGGAVGVDAPAPALLAATAQARALLGAGELPARAEVLAAAQSLAAAAVLDTDRERVAATHLLAGELEERIYRVEGIDQDQREALLLYGKADRDASLAAACPALERAALLSGEVAHDAHVTYRELYRARRRVTGTTTCTARLDRELHLLVGIRPPPRELETLDREDLGEAKPLSASALATVPTTQIVRMEAWPGPDATRVVFVLDGPAPLAVLDHAPDAGAPAEITIDFAAAGASEAPPDTTLAGIVSRVRTVATATGARTILDLAAPASRRVFHLLEPYRVVVDVARDTAHAEGPRVVSKVVLDPGHGGADPGAIGVGGNQEKDITLDIAHRTASLLAAQGLAVVLTRDDDRAVSLEERTGRANASAADLFISIHCNASESHQRHGIETYILDTTSDAIAGRVASRENATSQAASAELGNILSSMRMADQATRSARLARLVQRSAVDGLRFDYPGITDGGLHHAGFYVLVGARMPGVLFETSYLSNPHEETLLASDDYRQRMAEALADAVARYRSGE